jgi:hypothetical protein
VLEQLRPHLRQPQQHLNRNVVPACEALLMVQPEVHYWAVLLKQ